MKYILLFLLIVLSITSCIDYPTTVYTKPFIIIEKSTTTGFEARFTYQDINGNQRSFYDYVNKYNVGDTLK